MIWRNCFLNQVLVKLDFRSLHLRNKDYQMNGFQILSEEITINNTVNISKGIEIWYIWNKQFMDINISTNILSCHSLFTRKLQFVVACNNWSRHAYFDEKLAMSQIFCLVFLFLHLKLMKIFPLKIDAFIIWRKYSINSLETLKL